MTSDFSSAFTNGGGAVARPLLAFVVAAVFAPPTGAYVVTIAHRGASSIAPENTIAAVEAAYGSAWGVECDPRVTSDGHIVMMHDSTVTRTTNGSGSVSSLPFSYVRSLDAGSWFSPVFAGEQVPTISEQLAAGQAGGLVTCLDVKAGSAAQYLPFIQPYKNQVEVHCFTWSFLESLNTLNDGFTLVALGSGSLVDQVKSLPACVDKVSWAYSGLTEAGVAAAHAAGKQVYAWTINKEFQILHSEAMGVDGVVTDNPMLAQVILNVNPPLPRGEGLPRRLHDGLMMNWSFDDALSGGSPTTVADSVNGVDAELEHLPGSWQSGANALLGGALAFDGANDYASIPAVDATKPSGNALTVAAWVKLNAVPADMDDSYGSIYDSGEDSYVLYLDKGANELRFKVTSKSASTAAARPGIPGSQLDTANWHLVTGVYDGGAGVARIYLDGNLTDVHTSGSSNPDKLVGFLERQTAFFGRNGADGAGFFDGTLDETAVWDRALGQAEIAHLYNGGAGRSVQAANPTVRAVAPVVRLEFEGGLVNQGSGGTSYDGQWINGSSGYATYEPGVNGQAVHLHNPVGIKTNGDAVEVPFTLGDAGTISFWCKLDSLYDYQTLIDNSANGDDWEMWVASSGVANFRIESGSQVSFDLGLLPRDDDWHHLAVSWFNAGGTAVLNLYVNGILCDVDEGAWIDPGDALYIGGGNSDNTFANAMFDDFRIYDTMLATDEIVAIAFFQEAWIPGDANGDGCVDELDAKRLAENWGATEANRLMGDFNKDGLVDVADAAILAANWGSEFNESVAGSAPEPSICIFVIMASLSLAVMGGKPGH